MWLYMCHLSVDVCGCFFPKILAVSSLQALQQSLHSLEPQHFVERTWPRYWCFIKRKPVLLNWYQTMKLAKMPVSNSWKWWIISGWYICLKKASATEPCCPKNICAQQDAHITIQLVALVAEGEAALARRSESAELCPSAMQVSISANMHKVYSEIYWNNSNHQKSSVIIAPFSLHLQPDQRPGCYRYPPPDTRWPVIFGCIDST